MFLEQVQVHLLKLIRSFHVVLSFLLQLGQIIPLVKISSTCSNILWKNLVLEHLQVLPEQYGAITQKSIIKFNTTTLNNKLRNTLKKLRLVYCPLKVGKVQFKIQGWRYETLPFSLIKQNLKSKWNLSGITPECFAIFTLINIYQYS